MRTAKKNKQNLYYALADAKVPVWEKDEYGRYRTITIDGVKVPVENGDYEMGYSLPVSFQGNISENGDISVAEFGIDISGYDAILVVSKGSIPITETSLIWYQSEPTYKDAMKRIVDPKSADYTVKAIKPSLNEFKAILKRIAK